MNREKYPDDWADISRAIRDRSGGRCECVGECGRNHAVDTLDHIHWKSLVDLSQSARCLAQNYYPHPVTGSQVVLTVAHLDHDTTNNNPGNLRAFCQRCHNKYDAPNRRRNAAETRRKRQIDDGQMPLF